MSSNLIKNNNIICQIELFYKKNSNAINPKSQPISYIIKISKMTTFQSNNETILINDKFGLITNNQVIINKGSKKNKITLNSINKVNLIKRRVFYLNILLFLFSISTFIYSFFVFKSEKIFLFSSLILVGLFLLVYSIIHRFYTYKLIIREKNESIIEVKTTQINRKSIKEFYNALVQRIPKK